MAELDGCRDGAPETTCRRLGTNLDGLRAALSDFAWDRMHRIILGNKAQTR